MRNRNGHCGASMERDAEVCRRTPDRYILAERARCSEPGTRLGERQAVISSSGGAEAQRIGEDPRIALGQTPSMFSNGNIAWDHLPSTVARRKVLNRLTNGQLIPQLVGREEKVTVKTRNSGWTAIRRALPTPDPSLVRARDGEQQRSLLIAHQGAELYGSDRVLVESVRALRAEGWHVVITVPFNGPLVELLESLGAEVVLCQVPVLRKNILKPLGLLRFLWDIGRGVPTAMHLLRRYGVDGVYVNTLTIPIWIILGRLMRRPVLCHVHEAEQSMPLLAQRILYCPLLLTHKVVANSQFTLQVLVRSVPRLSNRISVINNGMSQPPRLKSTPSHLRGDPVLLVVGRLSPRKGQQLAIAAVAELRKRGINIRLNLLGSVFPGYERYEAELRVAARATGLREAVSFLGFDPNVWPYLEDCDIALVPSIGDESFGNVALEAIAAGRPVVVTARGGILEAVQGLASPQCVEADRADLLADAIERIITEWPRLRTLVAKDSEIVHDRYSVIRYGTEIVKTVRSLSRQVDNGR